MFSLFIGCDYSDGVILITASMGLLCKFSLNIVACVLLLKLSTYSIVDAFNILNPVKFGRHHKIPDYVFGSDTYNKYGLDLEHGLWADSVVRHHEKRSEKAYEKKEKEGVGWPLKRICKEEGDILLGGLMMVHKRNDTIICGPIDSQGGIQALEAMLYTLDYINSHQEDFIPGVRIGARILDDCDKDTYGLKQSVEFIKGKFLNNVFYRCTFEEM